MKNEIFIEYKSYSTGGDPLSDESWCSISDQNTSVSWKKAYKGHPGGFVETVEVDFDLKEVEVIFWVVVRYTTGDTFGTSYGNWEKIGCYKSLKEAREVEESIEDGTYEGYKCWDGYFEALEEIEINILELI